MNLKSKIETTHKAIDVWVMKRTVYLKLADFRIMAFPADKFTILKNATDKQIQKVKLILKGTSLRWEELDEDITIKGLLEENYQLDME